MIRLPSQVPRPHWLTMYLLICFSWNLEGMYLWLVWCSSFWQDTKLCWKPYFSRAGPLSYLRGYSGFSPQFDSNKTLFYSYYRLFIDYFHWYPSFIPDFSYLSLLSFILRQSKQKFANFVDLFKEDTFGWMTLYCLLIPSCIFFPLKYLLFPFFWLFWVCSSFPSCLRWKVKLLICNLSSFLT